MEATSHSIVERETRGIALLLALSLCACSEWPRYQHVPDSAEGKVASDVEPSTLIELEWLSLREEEPNDQVPDVAGVSFQQDSAVVFSGELNGIGWESTYLPEVISDEVCGSEGRRTPLETGDYLYDVDIFRVDAAVGGTLCARILIDDPSYRWDLLLFRLDSCGIPVDLFYPLGSDYPLGFSADGDVVEWSAPLTEAGSYAVQFAGFPGSEALNDPDVVVTYTLGISLLPENPHGPVVCPYLPDEVSP